MSCQTSNANDFVLMARSRGISFSETSLLEADYSSLRALYAPYHLVRRFRLRECVRNRCDRRLIRSCLSERSRPSRGSVAQRCPYDCHGHRVRPSVYPLLNHRLISETSSAGFANLGSCEPRYLIVITISANQNRSNLPFCHRGPIESPRTQSFGLHDSRPDHRTQHPLDFLPDQGSSRWFMS